MILARDRAELHPASVNKSFYRRYWRPRRRSNRLVSAIAHSACAGQRYRYTFLELRLWTVASRVASVGPSRTSSRFQQPVSCTRLHAGRPTVRSRALGNSCTPPTVQSTRPPPCLKNSIPSRRLVYKRECRSRVVRVKRIGHTTSRIRCRS